jgi:hypothetical protein
VDTNFVETKYATFLIEKKKKTKFDNFLGSKILSNQYFLLLYIKFNFY